MSNEELVKRIQDGINVHENLESLWENNSGYVAIIARKYEVAEELEDLINQGFIGLYKAAEMYKPDKGAKFLTYATYWITQSIQRYIQNCGKLSRVLGMCSLDKPIGEEEDMSMYDLIPSPEDMEGDAMDRMEQDQLRTVIWPIVDTLPKDQATVIRERYQERHTLDEIGKKLGTNKERVRHIEADALRYMRRPRIRKVLEPYWEEDRIYSYALRGTSAATFENTWTSSTERVAMKSMND